MVKNQYYLLFLLVAAKTTISFSVLFLILLSLSFTRSLSSKLNYLFYRDLFSAVDLSLLLLINDCL